VLFVLHEVVKLCCVFIFWVLVCIISFHEAVDEFFVFSSTLFTSDDI